MPDFNTTFPVLRFFGIMFSGSAGRFTPLDSFFNNCLLSFVSFFIFK